MIDEQYENFIETVYEYYHNNYRPMPWRKDTNPYFVLVSEIMLQQTQVPRVIEKFQEFINTFPSISELARASNNDVLKVWIGLGYNRRALFLKQTAEEIIKNHNGIIPSEYDSLIQLPGIGPATANAIKAYAYNQPVVFIETNIRTVFIHHFFPEEEIVSDAQLIPLIKATLDEENPKEWYWAVMDYGNYLKKKYGNLSRKSKGYKKQSAFKGSVRQIRARILKEVVHQNEISEENLFKKVNCSDGRFPLALKSLQKEGIIKIKNKKIKIKK